MGIAQFTRLAVLPLLALFAGSSAHAIFRCGNVYQDTPCDGGAAQPHLSPGKPAPAAPSAAPSGPSAAGASRFAAACSRIGEAAQQMVWKREGGATQEAQLAQLPAAGSRDEMIKTLDSVYRKRDSAPEIRAAVEAECVAEKQQAADLAASIKVLQDQQAQQAGGKAASAPAPAAKPADAEPTSGNKAVDESGPSKSCASWRSELDSINGSLRKGGSAAAMEQLQNRRRGVEKSIAQGRC